jgi:hypothetical protein
MRTTIYLLSILLAASTAPVHGTIAPGDPSLRADRVRSFTDTIALLKTPRDSAQRLLGTLVRRVERTRSNGIPIFRETQHYVLENWDEVDTLDVSATTLAPLRVVEISAKGGHVLDFSGRRMTGTIWSDSGKRVVDAPLPVPFFHGMMTEAFITAIPLAEGSTLPLSVAETPDIDVHTAEVRVTGSTTLHTARGPVECFVVRESERTTGWVSKSDGHLVRLHWTTPDGAEIWKLPKGDVPYLKGVDASGTRERPNG